MLGTAWTECEGDNDLRRNDQSLARFRAVCLPFRRLFLHSQCAVGVVNDHRSVGGRRSSLSGRSVASVDTTRNHKNDNRELCGLGPS